MSGFFNAQNVTAAKIVANFFISSCAIEMPKNATACACLEVRARARAALCVRVGWVGGCGGSGGAGRGAVSS